jgi:SEA/GATOR complex protein SEA3/WDR59
MRKSLVSIRDVSEITGLDQTVVREYAVSAANAGSFCQHNARVARAFGRTDHERLFRTLHALLSDIGHLPRNQVGTPFQWHKNRLARGIILSL